MFGRLVSGGKILGESDNLQMLWSNTSLPAGSSNVDSTAVIENQFWIITNLAFRYVGTAPTRVTVNALMGGIPYILYRQSAPVTEVVYDRQGLWVLKPGDSIRLSVDGATLNDDLFGHAVGYRFF